MERTVKIDKNSGKTVAEVTITNGNTTTIVREEVTLAQAHQQISMLHQRREESIANHARDLGLLAAELAAWKEIIRQLEEG